MIKAIVNWWGNADGVVEIPEQPTSRLPAREPQLPEPAPTPISVRDIPGDVPAFERIYSATLIRRIRIDVKIKDQGSWISTWGELTQPDGRWVLFDPDRIADKIIDPVLLPEVVEVVDRIRKFDAEFRRSRPSEFTDETGQRWQRVEAGAERLAKREDRAS